MATLETWNGRTASQTDAESPLDTTLMDGVRKDLDHLRQVLYGNNEGTGTYHTPIWGHNHNGTNSALVTGVADGSITLAKLKLTAGIYSTGTGGVVDINLNRYSHWIEIYHDGVTGYVVCTEFNWVPGAGSHWRARIDFSLPGAATGYATWDYHSN